VRRGAVAQEPPRQGGADPSALLAQGDLDGAIAWLRTNAETPAQSLQLGWYERLRGDFEGSARTMRAHLQRDPEDLEARLQLGYAEWMAGDLGAAEAALAQVERGGAAELAQRARTNLVSLREQRNGLEPVAAAARRLDTTFTVAVALLVAAAAATALMLRRA
jgi:thioredoxin-like negative regulator of GroEL